MVRRGPRASPFFVLYKALEYNKCMIFEMLRWWYGTGWLQAAHRIGTWTRGVERAFSASLLAKTLFSPWKRIVSTSGRSLDAKMHDAMDNFVSRCIGFAIRIAVLIAAGFATLGTLIAGVVMAVLWPLLPVLAIGFLVWGFIA